MKITRILNVEEKEFYDYLEQEVLLDIQGNTSHDFSVKNIKKGLKYTKYHEVSNSRIDIFIEEYLRGSVYQVKIKTAVDTITICYRTKQLDQGLEIIFNQKIESFDNAKHHLLMKWFSEGIYFGRMSDTLFEIQEGILKARNEEE